jgi:hypothetical protein
VRESTVFGMHWILDLELLLLFSCIALKWNRAKTYFVRSHSLPKNPFLQDKRFLENEVCGFSTAITRKCVYSCKPVLGGNLIVPPHLTPRIQCLPDCKMGDFFISITEKEPQNPTHIIGCPSSSGFEDD